jgi:hypothetical protein
VCRRLTEEKHRLELTVLAVVSAIETTVLICLFVVLRAVIWPMHIAARNQCDDLQKRLDAVTAGRDGWRDVAERTLVLTQLSKDVTRRATQLVAEVGDLDVVD